MTWELAVPVTAALVSLCTVILVLVLRHKTTEDMRQFVSKRVKDIADSQERENGSS